MNIMPKWNDHGQHALIKKTIHTRARTNPHHQIEQKISPSLPHHEEQQTQWLKLTWTL